MDEVEPGSDTQLDFHVFRGDQDSVVVRVSGDLDLSNVGNVEGAVEPMLRQPPERLVVDVAGLRFADSSALALWVRWANLVDQVEIRDPSELVRRLIERMGLADRLRLVP
jgi:anti-anti-sigma factor